MLNENNLSIAQHASKDATLKSRGLQGLYVTPEATVACDGHVLVRVSKPDTTGCGPEDFPEVGGAKAATDWKPFVMDAQDALGVARDLAENKKGPDVTKLAAVIPKGNDVIIGTTNLKKVSTVTVLNAQSTQYVRLDRVLDEVDLKRKHVSVKIDAKLLKELAGTIVDTLPAKEKDQHIILTFFGSDQTIRFDWQNKATKQDGLALLMPFKSSPAILGTGKIGDIADAAPALPSRDNKRAAAPPEIIVAPPEITPDPEPKVLLGKHDAIRNGQPAVAEVKSFYDGKYSVTFWRKNQRMPVGENVQLDEKALRAHMVTVPEPEPEVVAKPEPVPAGPRSWRPEIKTKSDDWTPNGLRFPTEQEAKDNALNLMHRWMAVTETRAMPSDDEPNYRWEGKLVAIEAAPKTEPEVVTPEPVKADPPKPWDFAARMEDIEHLDQGRTIINECETAVHDFMAECGVKPICGQIEPNYSKGFSVVKLAEIREAVKAVREAAPEQTKRFEDLLENGRRMLEAWDIKYRADMQKQKFGPRDARMPSKPAGPTFDDEYRDAVVIANENLARSFRKFLTLGKAVEAMREPCDVCKGKGTTRNNQTCEPCGGTRTQVRIKQGPDGDPVIVNLETVRF